VFYSSFTKLFLLLLLSIWRSSNPLSSDSRTTTTRPLELPAVLSNHAWIKTLLEVFDEDVLDREWVVRNLIGGMAAGFGLRGRWPFSCLSSAPYLLNPSRPPSVFGIPVALDCPPSITTAVILFGWGIKTVAAWALSGWVDNQAGGDDQRWIVYSIP
jgi:hypothetical protein